jgi:hypothetical protein
MFLPPSVLASELSCAALDNVEVSVTCMPPPSGFLPDKVPPDALEVVGENAHTLAFHSATADTSDAVLARLVASDGNADASSASMLMPRMEDFSLEVVEAQQARLRRAFQQRTCILTPAQQRTAHDVILRQRALADAARSMQRQKSSSAATDGIVLFHGSMSTSLLTGTSAAFSSSTRSRGVRLSRRRGRPSADCAGGGGMLGDASNVMASLGERADGFLPLRPHSPPSFAPGDFPPVNMES